MPRILADLPDEDIKWLDETATVLGRRQIHLDMLAGKNPEPESPEGNGA